MPPLNIKTPGVYINEGNAFPSSVVAVPTAVPAFVGYTPQAAYQGQSYLNKAVKISSFADFKSFFCYPDPPDATAKQYQPQYYLSQQSNASGSNAVTINDITYAVLSDAGTVYYLYNSVQLFYQNGGGDAYIVSVGTYGPASGVPIPFGTQVFNPNVLLADLQRGLSVLLQEQEPTLYICPEATLLTFAENGTLMQQMLAQCEQMQTAMSLLDITDGKDPDPASCQKVIATFRNNTGTDHLDRGAAYYPFIGTNVMQFTDIDYTNLFGGDVKQLAPLINSPSQPDAATAAILIEILNSKPSRSTVLQYHQALLNANPVYKSIIESVLADVNLLPPSGAMAGVMHTVDSQNGVWQAPANVAITGVTSLPINLSDNQQAGLNVDVVTGKSINAIRSFPGRGILVWGARTLDGNSNDWRYISVRRTVTMIEQSCKLAARAYVFAPNTANTWSAVKAMIENFLTNIWKQGGLTGAKPEDAFWVQCGLGTTMTADDILNGIMNIQMAIAMLRPAEFTIISFQQQMQKS